MRSPVLTLTLGLAVTVLLGCASRPIKAYLGPTLARDKVATLKGGVAGKSVIGRHHFYIVEVDGVPVGEEYQGATEVYVFPGDHTVTVDLDLGFFDSFLGRHPSLRGVAPAFVTFRAEAGYEYVIEGSGPFETGGLWFARVVNPTTGERVESYAAPGAISPEVSSSPGDYWELPK